MSEPTKIPTDRVYLVAQSGNIAGFNAYEDGSLGALPGSPFPTGAGTFAIKARPARDVLYVACGQGLGSKVSRHQKRKPLLTALSIASDGTLKQLGQPLTLPVGLTPVSFDISRDGRQLYLGLGSGPAGFFHGGVGHFRLADDGTPSLAGLTKFGKVTDGAVQPVISPDGRKLYAASVLARSVVTLDIREDGTLIGPSARNRASGRFPITPGFSKDGRTLYIAHEQSKSLGAFRVGDDGRLTELPSSPYRTGAVPHNPAFTPDGTYVYWANTLSNNVTGYAVQPDGSLVPTPGSPFATPVGPAASAISTSGEWLYLVSSRPLSGDKSVFVTSWRIGADGNLTRSSHGQVPTGLVGADGPSIIVLPVE